MSHLLPLLGALGRAGCDAHLLCLGEGGLAEEARRRELPVTVLPMEGARDARILRPLRRFLSSGPAAGHSHPPAYWDVVHTHGMRANLPVRLVAPILRRRPCLFTTVHSDLALDYESVRLSRIYRALDRVTAPVVDGIVCVSRSLRDVLVERGYPRERLVVIHSGLDPNAGNVAWAPSPDLGTGETDRAEDGSPTTQRPRIGTVARLVAVKDLELFVEVAGALRRTHPQVEAIIVGDGPERARVESLMKDWGLGGSVRLTGRLEEVGPVLRSLDVYMVTSVYEGGVSMSVLEAMANGIPVVTTAAGGVTEVVVEGETGYVVTRDQERGVLAAALAERAATLLDDSDLRRRMGVEGARRVWQRFTIEQTAAQTLRAYERCLIARDAHVPS